MTADLPEEICLTERTRSRGEDDGRCIRSDEHQANWRHPAVGDKSNRMSR
jgi:hypothetical protein